MKKTKNNGPDAARKNACKPRQEALELMSLLLAFAVSESKAKALSRTLVSRFGGVKGLLDASAEELAEVEGMDEAAVALINLMKPLSGAYLKEKIADKDLIEDQRDVINYLRLTFSGGPAERFIGLYLNSKNELIAAEILHEGPLAHSAVYPRKIIELAIKHNARSIIFVYNHHGLDTNPTPADQQLMRQLEKAASTVDLTVHDHMIIGSSRHFSARASGWPFEGPSACAAAAEKDSKS